jgi:hypothetical protein
VDPAAFPELLTPQGKTALALAAALAPTEAAFLACYDKLRKDFPPPLAKAALETVLLRTRARAKFTAADRMFFTREALEQASGEVVARHRAARFAPSGEVADLCCGIGGDTVALAVAGVTVHAVERDPLHAAMVRANAAAVGLADRVTVHEGDALAVPLPTVRAAFADPMRRAGGRRHLDPEDYSPPLSALRGRFPPDFPLAVKVAPGVARDDVRDLGAEAEFISIGGEMKECVLWFGPLRSAGWRATLLPSGATLASDDPPSLPTSSEPGAFVFDPDPAVVRAGLEGLLAEQLGLRPLDPGLALFTGPELVRSPFVTTYRVDLAERYHLKRLNELLRAHRVGRVTMVRRGGRVEPEDVLRKLKIGGPEHRFVILTRLRGGEGMIVGERVE